jgi:hypothetical protein
MQMEEFLKRHKHQSDVDQEIEKIEYNPEYWRSQPNTPSADVSEGKCMNWINCMTWYENTPAQNRGTSRII